ncbi:MAG: hypothetical protein ACM3KR_07380 [Deltaproteobacteria bacterium]
MNQIIDNITAFFKNSNLGQILKTEKIKRPNFEKKAPPGDGNIICYTVHVLINNKNIFGEKGSFLNDVFPRYKRLCAMLADYLNDTGIIVNTSESQISVNIIPYPNPQGTAAEPLQPLERYSRGMFVIPIDELKKSEYYNSIHENYKVEYGVMTNNGTVIGPDGGILASANIITNILEKQVEVVELGTGAAATPWSLMKASKLKIYSGNDFSPEMESFFKNEIVPRLDECRIENTFFRGTCYEAPLVEKADILIVGVYYEGQPDLFALRGNEICKCLGDDGFLIIQSGMLENPFVTQLLFEENSDHKFWPWYKEEFCVKKYFKYLSEQVMESETMLIATNDLENFRRFKEKVSSLEPLKMSI